MRTGSSTTSSDLGGSKRGETAARAQMQSSPAKAAAATASYSSRKSGSSRAERGGDCGTGSGESSAHAKETPSIPLRPQHTASAHSLSKRSCGGGGGGDKSIPPRMSTHSLTDDPQVVVVMASRDFEDSDGIKHEKTEPIAYKESVIIGNGSFGIVYKAKLLMPFECSIAIKKVLQDKHFKNREVEIMRKIQHPNIVSLFYFFFSSSTSPTSPSDKKRISGSTRSQNANGDLYLNLILEYIPETAHRIIRCYARAKESIPAVYVKVYVYQLLRAIGYLHQIKICHRDIKPQNLLICPKRSILKLCDFGSAKVLANDSVNVSYICSRYYRAPELIFGAVKYTCSIDTWSVGCVFAELLLTRPVFPGDSGVNQLVEIIKILGTPTAEQIKTMNPHYECFKFPQIKSSPWNSVFPHKTPTEAIDLIRKLLEYTPTERINPIRALLHPFFDDLRNPATRLPYKKELPPIFNFSPLELSVFDGDPNRESLTRIIDPTRNGLAPGNDNLPPPPTTTTILPSSNGLNNE